MSDRDVPDDPAVERAKKRVDDLKGFYTHLVVYLVVNTGLLIMDLVQGGGVEWVYWVMIGWGIGLAAHAASVFIFDGRLGSKWEAKKLEQFTEEERRREQNL